MKFFKKIIKVLVMLIKKKTFGFISISNIIANEDFAIASGLIEDDDQFLINSFEKNFANLIGDGYVKSYSAGRMGFYELMKTLSIGNGDEVIVNSGNCAVMINAILDRGAKPVYSDVDLDTFGSCPIEIEKKISPKTKMIVAQHSFGIPCKIDQIKDIASRYKIFLLEDCALALESKFKGIKLGNYGDASLFSFDHTKPLNGFSGGAIYTKQRALHEKLKLAHGKIGKLSKNKQKAMLKRHSLEQKLISSNNYKLLKLFDIIQSIISRFGIVSPYLNENSGLNNKNCSYTYPSKMPSFIANMLNEHIEITWEKLKRLREKNLNILINELGYTNFSNFLPDIYFDKNSKIVPLRLILYNKKGNYSVKKIFNNLLNIDEIWFKTPIVSSSLSVSEFGLNEKEFPKSVELGHQIINLPLDLNEKNLQDLIVRLKLLANNNKFFN